MPALVAGIRVLRRSRYKDVDGRNKSHDDPIGLNAMRTSTALARAFSVPARRINEIALGKRAITADTDLRLARYFNMPEGFFVDLQTDYELMERKRAIGDTLKAIRPSAT
jgi:antitoxin HigA-1